MPIMIREPYIERLIQEERKHRKHKTASKTLRDLAHERLLQLSEATKKLDRDPKR